MKTIEVIGYNRANLGKKTAKELRTLSQVPCVLYGGKQQVHFSVPMILFRDLLYTPEVHQVDLNIEGTHYKAIVQDAQFHPVNEMILHVDFLELDENKPVKMNIPVHLQGTAVGVTKGGKLISKLRKLTVSALPKDMPDYVTVDVSGLDLGKSIKVGDVKAENFVILNSPSNPVASIEIPRGLRGKGAE
ncbi:50S ribosomal protein L25/general stress protein Ctc [Cytophagaceae bacterium DM2B3-1]|uniref:Large ribosomal subunit protein bL25 n=1 Tax=Xanthocytophaga flava TaxID=3048013 RepID=A0AAE3QMN1_9BACT|nr:50S ribosomal protein L25/general stress protein Ctc [Xanthocytophaga flavus]MDJ1471650.1 50S ribosomal protein L25/general stress protein Ctc [Xanthocytophaga flavus]MDJ1482157.1 50S ribosomal protein L25/general stress protein Ctc [Xanthocytophaga flavus]MDJ1491703.1 50S ribosomal protein L25/general stress protein Ctc [Xanthocytophaga flavus]